MQLEFEESIDAPQALVFEVFTDLQQAPDNLDSIQSIEVIGGGPVGKGTRFRETRVMFRKETTEEMEIAEFDPPRMYMVRGYSCGTEFETTYRFQGSQRQTQLKMTMTSTPKTLFAKVVGPIMGAMMKGAMCKAMDADHAQLKAICESRVSQS